MFIFHTLVTDLTGILKPVALTVWPNHIPSEDKQSGSEALKLKKEFQKLLWEGLT